MGFANDFPIWEKLTKEEQERLLSVSVLRKIKAGEMLHHGDSDCLGLLLIRSGQLRVYTISDDGREVTLYRLLDLDICLLSASCVMPNIQFEVIVEAEKDTELWVIPSCLYKELMLSSVAIANFTNELISIRFSEIMWLMDQIMWKSFDKRLASFLLEESVLEDSTSLKITHEKIANHMGTAREVVTRMLRYFQNEEIVKLTRGTVELVDVKRLEAMREG